MADNNFESLQFHSAINYIHTVPDSFKTHWHKYIEVLFFPSTASTERLPQVRINQTDYFLMPGDFIIIWQGELHETVSNGSVLKGIQLPSGYITDLPEFATYISHLKKIHHIRNKEYPVMCEKCQHNFSHIQDVQHEHDNFRGIESLIDIYQIFISIGKYIIGHVESNGNNKAGSKTSKKISSACDYVTENCDRELTLDIVAEKAGFSTCYFSRAFKTATGYNFIEYLTIQRVKRAQELLAESGLSITEISYQSGFKSISTFNRVFRQYKGCSPTEYRKFYVN